MSQHSAVPSQEERKVTPSSSRGLLRMSYSTGEGESDAGGERRKLEFDASAAESGWNSLGEFELPVGEARVLVSDETSGRVVIADAIRWRSLSKDG